MKTVKQKIDFPKVFYCEECKVFFLTHSKMNKPTHPKCFGHKTRLATKDEVTEINKTNNVHYNYSGDFE